jgi:ATP-dependent helicase/nuclease subunit A
MSANVFPLKDNQLAAVDPADNVWLSASAGTGKTQVLSARVLRLLLRRDVEPGQILCLTFTKAGAAEMANRINAVLARWVRLEETRLATELRRLGAPVDPDTLARARTLFASVLDCPGGGLRIDTIHAFSQWLLASFPEEAELAPGSQPMDDRQRELLAREVLSDMLAEAERMGDARILKAVELFVTRKDPGALHNWLMRCAAHEQLWEGPGAWQTPVGARVRQNLLGIPANADEAWASEALDPAIFPDDQLRAMLPLMQGWSAQKGAETANFIETWLSLDLDARAAHLSGFYDTVLKKDGEPRKMDKPSRQEPRLPEWQQAVAEAAALYSDRLALLDLAELLAAALELGRAFAIRWIAAKRREGLLDFDDLIRRAASLLAKSETADWIRYKLDRRFDHILIDEAQDTNAAQWDIVEALIDDFFSGEGAAGDKLRTIFTVGDYKQAIFGFQGTSPENYERAKVRIRRRILEARENAAGMRERRHVPNWLPLDLGRSYRTAQPVLDFVNRAIALLGHEAFGLPQAPPNHEGDDRSGIVGLWEPVRADTEQSEDEEDKDWLPHHDTVLAARIAEQVRQWVRGPDRFVLEKDERRLAAPGDIMVLVRKRGGLAAQIVAKLHEAGVAVAGVDRLRLGAPLAVKDVMSALRFAAQPLDDLECANLLASPLLGWTQDDLLEHVPRGKDVPLWHHLRRPDAPPFVVETAQHLRDLLRLADFETPQALVAWALTGPWQGRRRLVARLGREANDPLDELLNAAFSYESANTPSLAGFIEWFDAGSAELKRDPDDAGGQVRVMTVHGSKGLQAPIVILADATGAPGQGSDLELADDPLGRGEGTAVPLPSLSKAEKVGPVADAEDKVSAADMQEHWRLLYVAMTRAEEALFLTGALGPRDAKKGPHEESWFAALEPVFEGDALADPIWGARREWGERAESLVEARDVAKAEVLQDLPRWATTPIGPEPRPPRPLAPSNAGEEQGADPPLAAGDDAEAMRAAMRRGVLIHRLLERLPDIAPGERRDAAGAWLERQAAELTPQMRAEMLASALRVLETPDFAEIFGPHALAEAPISAKVGGIVVTGTLDRLLVTPEAITIVDFKTTRRPPGAADAVPVGTLRQMAAYVAALQAIYPGRPVRAGLLYTQTPQLIELPAQMLDAHKDQLGMTQESYGDVGPEAY